MNKEQLIAILILFFIVFPAYAENMRDSVAAEIKRDIWRKVYADKFVVKHVVLKDMTFIYSSHFKDSEIMLTGNFDEDPELEVLVSFGTRSKTEPSAEIAETVLGVPAHFWQIYDISDLGYQPALTVRANDYPGETMLSDLDNDGISEVIVFSHGGAHGNDIYVCKGDNKGFRVIFYESSACGIEVDLETEKPLIKVGRENWGAKVKAADGQELNWSYAAYEESLWQVYMWAGDKFVYDPKSSTTPYEISAKEAMQSTVDEYNRLLKEK